MITEEAMLEGLEKTVKNAESFFKMGKVLFQFKFYARSYSSFHFCIEEVGRFSILFKALIQSWSGVALSKAHLKDLGYFDHQQKLVFSNVLEEATKLIIEATEYVDDDEIIEGMQKANENLRIQNAKVQNLNNQKNSSLYVDFDSNTGLFVLPEESFDEADCIELMKLAEIRLAIAKSVNQNLPNNLEYLKNHYESDAS